MGLLFGLWHSPLFDKRHAEPFDFSFQKICRSIPLPTSLLFYGAFEILYHLGDGAHMPPQSFPMMCQYCQEECRPIIPGPLSNGLYENRTAQCIPCNVDYYGGCHILRCIINNREYFTSKMDDHPNDWTDVRCMDLPSILAFGRSSTIILHFEHYVNFTPQNFQNKLKLYLIFS
jgi:hypothetical protein